ncbi:MAG: hypothetical protein IPJ17_19040 [Holophagales bacterium]|nr:MAG: hypothetical protein IPJ17_19040 [Holophagales bacterium]
MSTDAALHTDEIVALASLRARLDADRFLALAEGVDVHLVGGAVRDALLGRDPHDLDLVVSAGGERLARALASRLAARFVHLGGQRFSSFRLVLGDRWIDLWDREGAALATDLARRDLTLDAMALPASGPLELVDPLGGLDDLRARRLRATTPEAFQADPLRVLRLCRLRGELAGFAVENATLALARAAAVGLTAVAAERLRDELERLLDAPYAPLALETLEAVGGGWALFAGAGRAAAGALAVAALDGAMATLQTLGLTLRHEERRQARLAGLARAAAGRDAERFLEQLAAAGRLTRGNARQATRLLALPALDGDERSARRFLHAAGPLWQAGLALRLASGSIELEAVRTLIRVDRAVGDEVRSPRPLLRGQELASLAGLADGPALGALVGELRSAQIDGTVGSREEALAWLREQGRMAGGNATVRTVGEHRADNADE